MGISLSNFFTSHLWQKGINMSRLWDQSKTDRQTNHLPTFITPFQAKWHTARWVFLSQPAHRLNVWQINNSKAWLDFDMCKESTKTWTLPSLWSHWILLGPRTKLIQILKVNLSLKSIHVGAICANVMQFPQAFDRWSCQHHPSNSWDSIQRIPESTQLSLEVKTIYNFNIEPWVRQQIRIPDHDNCMLYISSYNIKYYTSTW